MNVPKIKDVMVRDVLTANKEDSVYTIVEKFHQHRMGALIVLDKKNVPIGIVTERDIIKGLVAYKDDTINRQAQDIMSAPLLTIESDEDIEAGIAEGTMIEVGEKCFYAHCVKKNLTLLPLLSQIIFS